MLFKVVLLVFIIVLTCLLQVANFASFIPNNRDTVLLVTDNHVNQTTTHSGPLKTTTSSSDVHLLKATTLAQYNQTTTIPSPNGVPTLITLTNAVTSTNPLISTTADPNADPEEVVSANTPHGNIQLPDTIINPQVPNEDSQSNNRTRTTPFPVNQAADSIANIELTVLFYSLFLAYVSFTKLIYHNIGIIKRNITEPGILMLFGIIWELVLRQLTTNYNIFPKFNSRVFFYLFLPSTVLESASLLSNKWLFINMLSILLQSIFGTLFYASSLGFTIYSLSRQDIFSLSIHRTIHQTSTLISSNQSFGSSISDFDMFRENLEGTEYQVPISAAIESSSELKNLTLADCLIFGTILGSIDSSTMLEVLRTLQVNEKLYYLILGENLMNNAVVLVIFDLLLEFFSTTRLTVVKVYMAIIQFFTTLIGSLFIGFVLAGIALVAVRLTKRFLVCDNPSSYQYQCQAMVETLLILKLAYLTYNVATFAGTSSILSLATFGFFQDQYIRHSLNLRSQLSFQQIILATKTMGFSLVYPLLGMLLVETSNSNQFFQTFSTFSVASQQYLATKPVISTSSTVASKVNQLADQANLYWNFKFLSVVMLLTVVFRFAVVSSLSLFCNLFLGNQLKIRFREQVLIAYGGLTGPLAFALVCKLIEHEEYRDRTLQNKHLFMYTILFITFISTILKGSFIKPLVYKMKLAFQDAEARGNFPIVLSEINCRVTESISHGLNSILGRTKSPYDKFAEFNEVHIKPRLAWKGSSINWLSVFYENLILDEILNVNCIKATASDTYNANRKNQNDNSVSNPVIPRKAKPSIGRKRIASLDTIDELGIFTRELKQNRNFAPVRRKTTKSTIENQTTKLGDSSLLKEFVMLNLKLEGSKKRQGTVHKGYSKSKVNPSIDDDTEPETPSKLFSTSSGELQESTINSLELINHEKKQHLDEIERRLGGIHQGENLDRSYRKPRIGRKRRHDSVVPRESGTSIKERNLLPKEQVDDN